MGRFLFAMCVSTLSTAPLSAEDDKAVLAAVAELNTQMANLETLVTQKKAAFEKAIVADRAAGIEWGNIRNADQLRTQVVWAGMTIALGSEQASEKMMATAKAQLREFVAATDKAAQPAMGKCKMARYALDQHLDDLVKAERDLALAIQRLDELLKK
jgi:hypothetical protein